MAESWRDKAYRGEVPESGGAATDELPILEGGEEDSTEGDDAGWRAKSVSGGTTLMDRAGALGRGAASGASEGMTALGGALAGGRAAASLPIPHPIGKGAAIVGGGVAGALAASPVGHAIREKLAEYFPDVVTKSAESEPENLRPWARAGEVVGGTAPFALAPFAAARAGVKFAEEGLGKIGNRIVESAAKYPREMALREATGTTGSAALSFTAEELWPNQPWPRIAAEVLGGFIHPSKVAATLGGDASRDALAKAKELVSEGGRMDSSAVILKDALEKSGEDAGLIVRLLREPTASGRPQTAGMKTGSPALIEVENQLKKLSSKFGQEQADMVSDNMEALRLIAERMEKSGDPRLLAEAANIKKRRFEVALETSARLRQQDAAIAAAKISGDDPARAGEISQAAWESLRKSLSDARDAESAAWASIPRDIPSGTKNIQGTYADLRGEMMPEMSLPKIVEDFVDRAAQGPVKSGDIKDFRSDMLKMGRRAAASGNWNDARRFGDLAAAALSDFPAHTAIDEARSFSNALHDVFTRAFAGTALERASTGAQKIHPELMLERALGSGGTAGALRGRQLREAADFPVPTGRGEEMRAAQERLLRIAAQEVVDPVSGRVNMNKAEAFIRRNAGLLEDFPEIKKDLRTAEGTQSLLARVERAHADGRKIAERESAFGRILKTEDPSLAVSRALEGPAPVTTLESFVKLAKNAGPDALAGFRTAALQSARSRSLSPTGEFSFARYWNNLAEPVRPGAPSMIEIMKKSGAMDDTQIKRFMDVINEAKRIEVAVKTGKPLDDIMPATDQIYDFALRVLGANVASVAPTAGMGAPFVVAHAGSKLVRGLFDRVPKAKTTDMLIKAAKDPDFMALLLERPASPKRKREITRGIEAFLWNAGLVDLPRDEDDTNAR